jgi:hypothetical protein
MTITAQVSKEEYARQVCLFLAEMIRCRRIKLSRAAEIAQKVVENINLIDSEEQFLKFINELSKDFQEMIYLGARVTFEFQAANRVQSEQYVREFVVLMLGHDLNMALAILQESIKTESREKLLENLSIKFPQFKEFLEQQKKWMKESLKMSKF